MRKRLNAAVLPEKKNVIVMLEKELKEYFAGKRTTFTIPMHFLGSDFQKNVWRLLIDIPPGETRSYKELAETVGNPSAFRAVARANGANQLAILVPCHRVINSNGDLGGYGGGLARKEWLLRHEKKLLTVWHRKELSNKS